MHGSTPVQRAQPGSCTATAPKSLTLSHDRNCHSAHQRMARDDRRGDSAAARLGQGLAALPLSSCCRAWLRCCPPCGSAATACCCSPKATSSTRKAKLARSGLGDLFDHVEIVSEKDPSPPTSRLFPALRGHARELRDDWQLAQIGYFARGPGWATGPSTCLTTLTWLHEQVPEVEHWPGVKFEQVATLVGSAGTAAVK